MTPDQFRKTAHQFVDWMADYLENIEQYPVRAQVAPGEIFNALPTAPPEQPESMDQIFKDFQEILLPGMTHWQHPKFFAYFPANSSYPSLLAEMLTATMGAQCMLWETSPAATEVEELVMNWLIQMLQLPKDWDGCIQTSASSSTLVAIISAREKYTNYKTNKNGVSPSDGLRVYSSTHIHSSIEKAVRIAGLGSDSYVQIEADQQFAMKPQALEQAIVKDIENGKKPICVVVALGTTSSTAVDPINEIAAICRKYDVWLHIDAAYAGTAMILPEHRHHLEGVNLADSLVFNPHKWMFTNFDCSAYFVKDKNIMLQAFSILPEYLKTQEDEKVINYKDWGIQLGRRFRALKLWFVIRNFGVEGIRNKLRNHIHLAKDLEEKVQHHKEFEQLAPRYFNMVCFRYNPTTHLLTNDQLNTLNELIINDLNNSGELYLTHTKLEGKYTIRWCIGQTNVEQRHVIEAWETIQSTALRIEKSFLI